jgi:hypothetical protein
VSDDIVPWREAPAVPGLTYRAEARSVVVLYATLDGWWQQLKRQPPRLLAGDFAAAILLGGVYRRLDRGGTHRPAPRTETPEVRSGILDND